MSPNASSRVTRASDPSARRVGALGSNLVTALADLPLLASGKVREIYDLDDSLLIVASDRISTYDVVHPTAIPDKGSGAHRPVDVLV